MATTFIEIQGSGRITRGTSPVSELIYHGSGEADGELVADDFEAILPATFDGLPLANLSVEEIEGSDHLFLCEATYQAAATSSSSPGGGNVRRFSTGGGTIHITHSIATIASYGDAPPDLKQGINYTDNGPAGVDIQAAAPRFSETVEIDDQVFTTPFQITVSDLTYTTNLASFKGFAAGEVLFLGMDAQYNPSTEKWDATFSFERKANETGIQIGDMVGISANGWQYIHVLSEEREDPAGKVIKHPVAAYVEQVYYEGNFALLGVGT